MYCACFRERHSISNYRCRLNFAFAKANIRLRFRRSEWNSTLRINPTSTNRTFARRVNNANKRKCTKKEKIFKFVPFPWTRPAFVDLDFITFLYAYVQNLNSFSFFFYRKKYWYYYPAEYEYAQNCEPYY